MANLTPKFFAIPVIQSLSTRLFCVISIYKIGKYMNEIWMTCTHNLYSVVKSKHFLVADISL